MEQKALVIAQRDQNVDLLNYNDPVMKPSSTKSRRIGGHKHTPVVF